MARSKKALNLDVDGSARARHSTRTPSPSRTRSPPSPESERPAGPLSITTAADRDVVKVNNANTTELKNACDDAVKRVSTPLTPNITPLWGSAQVPPQITLHSLRSLSSLNLSKAHVLTCAFFLIVPVSAGIIQANSSTYRCTPWTRMAKRFRGRWHGFVWL